MNEISVGKPRRVKRRLALPAIVAGGLSSLLLAFSLTPTFSALTASIRNDVNTAGTGTLIMTETDAAGTVTCKSTDGTGNGLGVNSATCSTINKYGGSSTMKPGDSVSTKVHIKSTGTVEATTFSVQGGTCTPGTTGSANGGATDICDKMTVKILAGSTQVYSGAASAFAAAAPTSLSGYIPLTTSSAGQEFTITVSLPSTLGNTYQGLKISQPITWTFGA